MDVDPDIEHGRSGVFCDDMLSTTDIDWSLVK